MLTCNECGCLVDPEATDLHQDWHEELITKKDLTHSALANPRRSRLDDLIIKDC